jgi:hypothetical protein
VILGVDVLRWRRTLTMKSVNSRDDEALMSLSEYVIGRLGRRVRTNPDDDEDRWWVPHQC